MAASADSEPAMERQRAEIEAAFRERWPPPDAGRPRVLTMPARAEARRAISHGGLTSLDQVTLQAVRGGTQPGDLLPYPYIEHVTDAEVIITGAGPQRRVAVLFSHQDFPGVRFGHRFPPDADAAALEKIWLKEEIETGALDRMMQTRPPPTKQASCGPPGKTPTRIRRAVQAGAEAMPNP